MQTFEDRATFKKGTKVRHIEGNDLTSDSEKVGTVVSTFFSSYGQECIHIRTSNFLI